MKRLMLRALYATLFTGGLTLLGAGVAHASETSGDDAILSGSQLGISIEAPITLAGNAISLIGDSSSSDATTDVATGGTGSGESGSAVTSGDHSILGGTQALIDISIPVTIGGNAISVIGDSSSSHATTDVATGDTGSGESGSGESGSAVTSGDHSILGGTQALIGVSAPITVGGNAISVIGDSTSSNAETVVASGTGGGSATTDGTDGLLGGTQLIPNLSLPITIGGNAISVVGDSTSDGSTVIVAPTDPADPTDPTDPTDPVDPTDPTDPTNPTDPDTPGTPGTPGTAGTQGDGSSAAPAASSDASVTATPAALASTGLDAGFWERLALVLVLIGLAFFGLRKLAFRR